MFLQLKNKKIHNFAFILSFVGIGYVTSFLILLSFLQGRLMFVMFRDVLSSNDHSVRKVHAHQFQFIKKHV